MKKQTLILIVFTLLFQHSSEAQRKKEISSKRSSSTNINRSQLENIPFKRNVWEIATLKPNVQASRNDVEFNGVDQGSQSNFLFDAGVNYYVADGFGVGAEFYYNVNTNKSTNTKVVNTNWMTYANLTYGVNVTSNFNLYGRFGAGVGGVVNKFTASNGNTVKNTSNTTGYKFALGGPIRVDRNYFFTPEFSWHRNRQKFDGGVEIQNRLGLNLTFNSYLGCNKASCDDTKAYRQQHDMYAPGRSFLGISTRGGFYFGDTKIEYDNNTPNSDQDFSGYDLSANYNYFVARDFSLGLNGYVNNSYRKFNTSNSSNSFNGYGIGPVIQLNIPSQNHFVNDFFLRTGANVGGRRSESKSGSNSNVTKYSTTDVYAGVGHNCFFSRKLAFTTTLQYDWFTVKNKDNDNREKFNGLYFSVGINKYFD